MKVVVAMTPARAKSSGRKEVKKDVISVGGRKVKRRPQAPVRCGARRCVFGAGAGSLEGSEPRARRWIEDLGKKRLLGVREVSGRWIMGVGRGIGDAPTVR